MQKLPGEKGEMGDYKLKEIKLTYQPIEMDPELTQMSELIEQNIKTVVITLFHRFKRLEKRLNMLSRNMDR